MQQCHTASLPVGASSPFVKERGKCDFSMLTMLLFKKKIIWNAPIFSLYGEAPDDGVKLISNKYWNWRICYSTQFFFHMDFKKAKLDLTISLSLSFKAA